METDSLSWFRLSKCLVAVGTEVLHELLKFNILTYSFSEYHKLWLKKVDSQSKSDGLHMLWTSLDQQYRSLDTSSQQNLQSLFSKLKQSCFSTSMEICQQISVLKDWEDEIQNSMNKHPTQENALKKWLIQMQELSASNASLVTVLKHWTQEFINLCQAEQLKLLFLIGRHHERINNLSADFLKKLEFSIRQGQSGLHNVFKGFKQDEVNSQIALQSELRTFLISWQPKINRLLNVWITDVLSSPHQKILQNLVMDVKNCLPRVYQMCQTSVLDICSIWHKNLRKKLAEWERKLHQVDSITIDLQDLAITLRYDLQGFPSAFHQQISDFFDSKKPDLKRLRTCGIISDPQWLLLYPANGYIDLRTFDISLLCTLHRNVYPVCPPELGWCGEISETDHSMGADLMRLKKFRNDLIAKFPDPVAISQEFEKLWPVLEASFLRLSKILDEEFKAKINQKVAELKTCPFDFREEVKLQLELINWYKDLDLDLVKENNFEKCLGLIHTIQKKVEVLHQYQALNMPETNDFKTKMDTIRKEVIERLPRMKRSAYEIKSRTESRDTLSENETFEDMKCLSASNVNQTTLEERIGLMRGRIIKHRSDNADVHVRTRAFDHAKEILSKHSHVVVQGKPGEGKTYIGLSLLADLTEIYNERQPVIIYDANDWQNIVDMSRPLVILLDDVLGKFNVSKPDLDQWIKISELVHLNFSFGSIFLIICIRTQIALDIKLAFQTNDAFSWMFNSNVVDISSEGLCLTKHERKTMLMKYDPDCMNRNDTSTVETILGKEHLIGFAQNCKMFRCMKSLNVELREIFTNDMFLINEVQYISKKSPKVYTFLVLLMLSDGSLSLESNILELDNKIKIISELCCINERLNIVQLRDIGNSLCDTYVAYNQAQMQFSFQHDCIETAFFISFGKDYPDVTLRLCSLRQISQMCCVKNESDQFDGENLNFKMRIDHDQFSVICERFREGLESGERESFKNISEALVWTNLHFVSYFADTVTSRNDVLKFLSQIDPDGWSLLVHFINAGSILVVEKIIQIISHFDLEDHNLVTRQLSLASTNACLSNEKHMLNNLIECQKRADDFVMLAAGSTGNISVLKMLVRWGGNINATLSIKSRKDLVNDIKYCRSFPKTPSYHYDINLFHIACSNGKTDMVKYLMASYPELVHRRSSEGYTAGHFAALSDNAEIMKLLFGKQIAIIDRTVYIQIQPYLDIEAVTNNGSNLLHIAAENANLTIVKYLIKTHFQLTKQTDRNGWTAVHSSAVGGSVHVIKALIQAGLDTSIRIDNGANVLHIAAATDNLTMVQYLIEHHSKLVKQTTGNKWTTVHFAAKGGSVPMMKTMIQAGLDIAARTSAGLNVLHIAAANDNLTVVKYLVATYPQLLKETDDTGWIALHYAAEAGRVHVMETLLQAGINITARSNTDRNVLHIAAVKNNLSVVEYLVTTYPHLLQETDENGWTAVHCAALTGSVRMIEILIQAGLDVTARTLRQFNVLHIAAEKGKLTVLKYLITSYPQLLQEVNEAGWTALHCAAQGGSVHVVETLIQAGLDVTARDNEGSNVLHISAMNDNLTVVKYFISMYPQTLQEADNTGWTALLYAAQGGSVHMIETMIEAGFDVTARTNSGSNLLHIAARNDNLTVVKYFIKTYPQTLQETDNTGWTALHYAAQGGSVHVMETLIQAGLDFTARTNNGSNILHIASVNNRLTLVISVIAKYSQTLQETNKTGWTALHYACQGGSVHVTETLIHAGLDFRARTNNGSNVLHIAAVNDSLTLVKYFLTTYPQTLQETNSTGWTALHYAAQGGSVHVMETLIQAGLDFTARSNDGSNVLQISARTDNLTVVKYFIAMYPEILQETNNTGWTALHYAAQGGSVHVMETLIRAGLNTTSRDNDGSTVLHIAARNDNLRVVKYFIVIYPQTLQNVDKTGWTALHHAAQGGSVHVIEALIHAGLDFRAKTNDGSNVLHIAAKNDNLKVVKYFITTYPETLQETNNNARTALYCAAEGGSVHVIETLIKAGLDIRSRDNDGSNVVHIAAKNKRLTVVEYFITMYPETLETSDNTGWTVLHYAVHGGSLHMIEALIHTGLDFTARTNNGSNVFHIAARNDNLTVLKYFIAMYPQTLQETDNNGWTALHYAAQGGSVHVIETLIQAGLDFTARTNNGRNVLHIAARKDNLTVVKYCIATYPQTLQETDYTGWTALHYAAQGGSVHVIETLIQAGLNVTTRTNDGSNSLHIAARNDNITVVKFVIAAYPHTLKETDNTGWTALHNAAQGGSVHVMEALINAGLDLTTRTNNGSTALHIAARNDNLTLVQYFIATYPQTLQETNNTGWTALHYAAQGGSVQVTETLIHAGLAITSRDNKGSNVLHIAAKNDNLKIVKYFIKTYPQTLQETNNTGWTALHYAAQGGGVHVIDALLQTRLDLIARDEEGSNFLHIAAKNDNLTAVKYCIATYPQTLQETNNTGWTALHYAAQGGSVHVIEALIQAGIDFTARTNDGSNVLHIAARNDKLTVIKHLIATHPQTLPETNNIGWTALHCAAQGGSVHLIEALIQAGLDFTSKDNNGSNVIHIAAKNDNVTVVQYFIKTYPQTLKEIDNTGCTALHYAAQGGSAHVMETLIHARLAITSRNNNGSNVLHMAAKNDNVTVVQYFIKTYPQTLEETDNTGCNALHYAAQGGSVHVMETLIQAGLDITARTNNGSNVLHIAARNDNITVVKYFIKTYPQTLQETDNTGWTALHYAAQGGSVHVMETLIQAGLDITARTNNGSNVLHIAARNDNITVVKYFIAMYPQTLQEIDNTGLTALHYAAQGGSVHVIEALIQAGLDITARTNKGSNVLHIAAKDDNLTAVKYFITTYPQTLRKTDYTGWTALHYAAQGGSVHVIAALIQAGLDFIAGDEDGSNVLHIAAKNDNLTAVKYYIATYPETLQETSNTGWNALHYAAEGGSVHVMETLIRAGLDITARTNDGSNVLHIAAMNDNLTLVKYFMATYPQTLQETNNTGWTTLHYAAQGGSVYLMKTLIQAGLDITSRDNNGSTALHIAARNDNLTVVKYFIATYPQILQVSNSSGWTAMHFAAQGGSVNLMKTLIQAGLDIRSRDNNSSNILHIAAKNDNVTVVKYFITTYPQTLETTDNTRLTALHYGAQGGSVHMIEALIRAGLDFTARTNDGGNILHIAARNDNLTAVKYFIAAYPQTLQETDNTGWTALHNAAQGGSVHVIEALIQAGLAITARDSKGSNVLHIAARNDNLTVVKYFIAAYPQTLQETNNTGWTALHYAALGGSVHMVQTLIQAGLDITARNINGSNVLHISARNDNLTVVKYLIATYPQTLQETNNFGLTALHYAAQGGSAQVIEALIHAGLDFTARTVNGTNVLHIAARNNNLPVVKYLIAAYPHTLEKTDNAGWTALHYAAQGGSVLVIEALLQAGLDFTVKTNNGRDVLQIASSNDNLSVVKHLIERTLKHC